MSGREVIRRSAGDSMICHCLGLCVEKLIIREARRRLYVGRSQKNYTKDYYWDLAET